jgi:apolipoprotein N-acyltransferase
MSTKQVRTTAFPLLATATLTAGWMYWQNTQELLWGYAPLLLYLTSFSAYFLLRNYPGKGEPKPDRWWAPAAGLLLGTGFAGDFSISPNLFFGFALLFVLHDKLRARGATFGEVLRHGFTAFLLFNLLTTYWVTNTGFGAGFFAMLANSALMCLPWLAMYWTSRRSPKIAVFAFAVCWLAFEHLHYNWGLNWPWLTLGNGLANWPGVIQWYEITGVLGGSAWILAGNYLAFKTFFAPFDRLSASPAATPGIRFRSFRKVLPFAALLLLPMVGSLIRYHTYVAPAGEIITVAAIQPNFEPHYEKFSDPRQSEALDTFIRLSQAALAEGPLDYLLFPETSFSGIEEQTALTSPVIRSLGGALNGLGADYLVTGFSGYYRFSAGETHSPAVRYSGNVAYEALNAAIQIRLGTKEFQTYRKGVFVPGAESFPFREYLPFMEPLVASVGGSVAGLGTQAKRIPLVGKRAKVAPVICYESVFGAYFIDYIRAGAQAIFVMTNDGWWDNTAGHQQHLWYSSLRAIETRRAVVRAANVGACAFINQRGKIISKTPYNRAGFLRGELLLNDAITPYVRFGDMVSRLALLLAGMVLLNNLARTLKPAE